MKFQYLGTAACEGVPALFCECERCIRSRKLGGRNIRTRSQAIIDDTLLIDFPPDTLTHFYKYDIPMPKITTCIITHSHFDHLYVDDIAIRKKNLSTVNNSGPLCFYSDKSGYDAIADKIQARAISSDRVVVELAEPNKPFEADGYKITPLRATHAQATSPLVYIIEKNGKSVLYAHDTSDFPEETWDYLKTLDIKLNMASLDCTSACLDIDFLGHMNLERCINMRKKLMDIGLTDDNTRFILNHFSHNGTDVVYDDFVKIAYAQKFQVSYDGMIVEI